MRSVRWFAGLLRYIFGPELLNIFTVDFYNEEGLDGGSGWGDVWRRP